MPDRFCKLHKEENGIAILTIPGLSTLPALSLLETLQRQIALFAGNSSSKGIILTGTVDGFCRCSSETAIAPYEASALSGFGQQVMFSLERTGKPCVAALSGKCTGLGLELALACDFIVASDSASFGFPGIADGNIPFCGGTQRLVRLVGKSKSKELIYSGELIDAAEAFSIKLTNRLYSADGLMPGVQDLMSRICTRSPHAIRIGSEVVNAGYDIDLKTACMLER
ncbi:MAG: enoyl-CoA hydratase/isomerase family protein, partial [Deltaproteobacteria bacterium]